MARSDAPTVQSPRGLLALVIILGALIVLGVIGLIVAAVFKAGNRAPADVPAGANGSYAATVIAPGEHIESTQLEGNRILLRLSGPNGEELVVIEAASGRVVGRIAIAAKP
ncbi:MAG TPA: hypothetical protein VHT51_03340 [Micropepsaceae bacterium]|jgi:hypothetical protein|nr:hypothetical protein [Micropepsaceae bacterium]